MTLPADPRLMYGSFDVVPPPGSVLRYHGVAAGADWDNLVLVVSGTLAGLAAIAVPAAAQRVLIQRYDEASLDAPAWYARVATDPGIPLAGQDATGGWFRLVESPASPEMAGAHGDNVNDDGPAFCRLLQCGSRVVRGRVGATYRVARDGTTRCAMHNAEVPFDAITLDLTGCEVVLDCDGGVDEYASYLQISGLWNRFTLLGGTYRYSTPPFLHGTVTAVGVGTTAADAWFEFQRAPTLSHPFWADIRICDIYDPESRRFVQRAFGNFNSDINRPTRGPPLLKNAPGFPMTLTAGSTYRVDMRNAIDETGAASLATALELRDKFAAGQLIGMQYRRDTAKGIGIQCDEHNGCQVVIADVTVHHCDTVAVRCTADGGQVTRLRVVPDNADYDVYSTNAGVFRLQDCRGQWVFDDCTGVSSGDDGFVSSNTSQRITATPTTDGALTSKQLRCLSSTHMGKPLVGDVVQLRDWETGFVDQSAVWHVVSLGPEVDTPYLMTLDTDVNPAWAPTGTVIVPPVEGEIDGGGEIEPVGDGTGWVLDTVHGPQIFASGGLVKRNRGVGWLGQHIAAGSQIQIDAAIDNAHGAVIVGNEYPHNLVGAVPYGVNVHVGVIENADARPGIAIGGYAGNTRALAASEFYVRDIDVVVDAFRNMPRQLVSLRGATRVNVGVASAIRFGTDPNENNPETFRVFYGTNTAHCTFDGALAATLSRWDVLFNSENVPASGVVSTSHDNIIISPARARNWLNNPEWRQAARGTTVALGGTQAEIFDRWQAYRTGGTVNAIRSVGFGSSQYCLRVQRTAVGTTLVVFGQQLPAAHVAQLRGRRVLAYCQVRGGTDVALEVGTPLRAHLTTGTVAGEVWDMTNTTTGGFTGGVVTVVNAMPDVIPTTDGAVYDYVTEPVLVPDNAAAMGFQFRWTPPAAAPGAADYIEFSPIALVIAGAGYDADFATDEVSILTGTATYNPPSLADNTGTSTDVPVVGAVLGDFVEAVSFSLNLTGVVITGSVLTDAVRVRFENHTGGVVDLGSGTVRVRVRRVAAA